MRDLVAIIIVLILVACALAMATSLQWYRRGHERHRRTLVADGHTIVAEVPVSDGLTFFSEDVGAFYWSERRIPKRDVRGARLLISGAPLSGIRSRRFPNPQETSSTPDAETVERERWDVEIDLGGQTVLVECGSIRQQVSQEMARRIYESVKRMIETHDLDDHHSLS